MKKRANLITRVALAATIFVTALAGVTPMTAKAAPETAFEVTQKLTEGGVETEYGISLSLDFADGTGTAPTTKQSAPYTLPTVTKAGYSPSWSITNGLTAASISSGAVVLTTNAAKVEASYTPTPVTATVSWEENAPGAPTITAATSSATVSNGGSVTTGTTVAITITAGTDSTGGITYSVNGEAFKEYTGPFNLTINNDTNINAKAKNVSKTTDATLFSIKAEAPVVTAPKAVLKVTPATGSTIATGEKITFAVNASETATTAISSRVFYSIDNGATYNYFNYPNTNTITVGDAWSDLTQPISFIAYAEPAVASYSTSENVTRSYTISNVAGSLAKIESVKWRSNYNGANLGNIASEPFKTYTDDPRTVVYEISGDVEFANGTPHADIISELKKTSQVEIDLDKESNNHNASVEWLTASKKSSTLPYNNSEADSDQMNTYDIDSKNEDTFIVYSKPIEIWSDEDKYHIDSAGAQNIRLKLRVKILKEGETANTGTSTGSSAPTNLTFNPGDGTYVTPNSIIRFSATASSGTVKYNVTSGNIAPTTSNGADGANGVTIPGSVSAGDYKMNVNAYTNSSNTTTKSATFKVVTNNKYNVTYDNGVLTCDGDFGNFKGLWITNAAGQYEFVPAANYAVASGSTVVTLSPTYLMTQTGAKSVRMVYTDGYAEGNFTLTAGSNAATPITDPTAGNTNTSGGTQGGGRSGVGTDDRSELVIMFVLLGMLIAGFVVSVYYKNEKLRRNRYMD